MGVTQTLAATAVGLMQPESEALVNSLWIGAGVSLVVFLILLYRASATATADGDRDGGSNETGFDSAAQSGVGSTQAIASRGSTAKAAGISVEGNENIVKDNTIIHGDYYAEGAAHKEDDGRIYLDRTPEELTAPFAEHATDDAQRIVQKYLGHWLRVEGTLRNREEWLGNLLVSIDNDDFGDTAVFLYFSDERERARVSLVRRGQRMTAKGQLERVGDGRISLKECEVTETLPLDAGA